MNEIRVKFCEVSVIAKLLNTSRPTVTKALAGERPITPLRSKIRTLAIQRGGVEVTKKAN